MMTIEQRLEQLELQNQRIERQNQRIERKNRRLTAALTVMAVAICAVVTMALRYSAGRARRSSVASSGGRPRSVHRRNASSRWGAFRMAGAAAVLARCQMRWQTDLGQ